MVHALEDEEHFLMECPAYQAMRGEVHESCNDCGGKM
jgi:hypothetical protein